MSSIYSRIELGPTGEISGELFAADQPGVVRVLEILLDDRPCAETICDLPGVAAGDGDRNGFAVTLPLGQMWFNATSRLSFRDKASEELLDRPRAVPDGWRERQMRDHNIAGYLENVTENGLATGWVWAPGAPNERLLVTVLLDDAPVLSTIASIDRADIRGAGIGDGRYGFSCSLPWDAIAHERQVKVSVRATPMMVPFGKSFVLRRDPAEKMESRLLAAEAELKRVRGEFAALKLQMDRSGLAASASLFETVGAFFTSLAAGAAAGEVPVLATRRGASLGDLQARYPKLRLGAPSAAREARVVIPAVGSMDAVVDCLEALVRTGIDRRAEILLFDDGSIEEAALLPALIRNLRYLRVLPGEDASALRNQALLSADAPTVVLLAPAARPQGGWFDLLQDALVDGVAAVGAGMIRDDGLFHSTGLLLGGGAGRLLDIGAGKLPTAPAAMVRRSCDVLGFGCVALSRDALGKLGGFDATIADWSAALLNFCLTARSDGWRLMTEPAARVDWLELADQPVWFRRHFGSATPPMPHLRLRWKKMIQAADGEKRGLDRGYRAHVLVADPVAPHDTMVELGCRVTVLGLPETDETLRRLGVEFTDDAAASGAGILWVSNPELGATLRQKLPDARIVLARGDQSPQAIEHALFG